MKKLLSMIEEASETADKLENILFDIKCHSEWENELDAEEYLKEALIKSIHSYEWDIDCESNKTYENEPEKRKAFFLGVNSGYYSALFWMADYMGLVNYFEKEVSPLLKFKLESVKEIKK